MRSLVLLLIASCGHAGPSISSTITLKEGLQASDIKTYRLSVVAPIDAKGNHLTHTDGSPLSCADFLDDTLPTKTLSLYADQTFTLDPNNTASRSQNLTQIPVGKGYWVLGEAFGGTAQPAAAIARACTSDVDVSANQTTAAPIEFFPCAAGPVDNPGLVCQ